MKLNNLFTSHMVLPMNKEFLVFGEGKGIAKVVFNGIERSVDTDSDKWEMSFPPMDYGGPYEMKVTLNGDTTVLDDIYIGKVYLFAGQSNMQFKIEESTTKPEDCKPTSKLRLFSTDRVEDGEYFFSRDGWIIADSANVDKWPAIPYLVSEYLSDKTDIAVGAVACYQGASVIESWVPKGAFESIGINIPIDDRHKDHVDEWFGKWNKNGDLYDFAFKQVVPFTFNGVIWYQGESDSSVPEGKVYAEELCELIKIWRRDLRDENLPFVVIQIADYDERDDKGWHLVQEGQLRAEKMLPNVKTVISRDISESFHIHPPTKTEISKRIAKVLCEF